MSLWVYLEGDSKVCSCECERCGNEHSRATIEELYCKNITSNLAAMAREAGIEQHLWDPQAIGITKAFQLIEPLKNALYILESEPSRFEKLNSPNGWGLYKHFVPFVREYLEACDCDPNATVRVSR